MRKVRNVQRAVAVAGLAAGLVGIGGAYSSAFADTTPTTSPTGLVTTDPCPTGWHGAQVGVDGHKVFACTDLLP